MRNLNRIVAGLLMALLAAPSTADAQPKRTVASANAFLASALTNGAIANSERDGSIVREGEDHAQMHVMVAQGDGCLLTVRLRGDRDHTVRIDWSRISGIEDIRDAAVAYGIDLDGVVEDMSGKKVFVFFLPSREVAERTATAMKFIKDNCDPGKGTGF